MSAQTIRKKPGIMVPTTTPEFDKKTDNRMPRKFRKVESHSKKMAVKKMYHRFEANSGLKMYAMLVATKVTAAGYHGMFWNHSIKIARNPSLGPNASLAQIKTPPR